MGTASPNGFYKNVTVPAQRQHHWLPCYNIPHWRIEGGGQGGLAPPPLKLVKV